MKVNYKANDKVKITKPGTFDGLEGEVNSNHPEKQRAVSVTLFGGNGTWSFTYDELQFVGKDSILAPTNEIKIPKQTTKSTQEMLHEHGREIETKDAELYQKINSEPKQKRTYKKKDKTAPPKIKRTYNKKQKA